MSRSRGSAAGPKQAADSSCGALLRLRRGGVAPERRPCPDRDRREEAVFRLYLQAVRLRDPRTLWAMLTQPTIRSHARGAELFAEAAPAPHATACSVMQTGGQLGLVLTLDGVVLCVLPLGVLPERGSTRSSDPHEVGAIAAR